MVKGKRKSHIDGFEGLYEINELGEIRVVNSFIPEWNYYRYLKTRIDRGGYLSVRLSREGKTYTRFVHRLLAEHFVKYIPNKSFVNHKNGNKLNNSISNLEFVTHRENVIHAYEKGLNSAAKMVYDCISEKTFTSVSQAASFCNIPVSSCANRLRRADPSFRLRYVSK